MIMKIVVLGFTFGVIAATLIGAVQARDDGRYTLSPLKPWFDSLKSGKGRCCSDADGFAVFRSGLGIEERSLPGPHR
jgi:hypothetical protein